MTSQLSTAGPARMDPRIKARRIAVRRVEGRRRLQRLVDVGLVLVVVLGFAAALWSPLLDVDGVEVVGAARTDVELVRERLGIEVGEPLLDVDLAAAGAQVAALPWVDEVRLDRNLDGTVHVEISERQPVAIVGPPGAEVVVDAEGRVLAGVAEPGAAEVPLVRVGGVGEQVEPGSHVDPALQAPLALAGLLAAAAPGAVEHLDVTAEGLVASLAVGGEARFGEATQLADKVRSLRTILEQVELACLEAIDLRLPGSPVLTRYESCS